MKKRRSRRFGGRLRNQGPILKAWAVFLSWIGLFSTIAVAGGMEALYGPLVHHVASAVASTLTAFGHSADALEGHVVGTGFILEIIPPCTGLLPALVFIAAVLAFPCPWRKKVTGLALGVTGLYLLNHARVVSLYVLGLHFPSYFEQAHILIWQPLMMLAAVAFWLLWIERFTSTEAESPAP